MAAIFNLKEGCVLKKFTLTKMSVLLSAGVLLAACNQDAPAKKEDAKLDLENPDVKLAYAIGAGGGNAMAKNLETLEGTEFNVDKEVIIKAFAEGVRGESKMDDTEIQTVMGDFRGKLAKVMQERRRQEMEEQAEAAKKNVELGKTYLEENKAKDGVVTTESGLQYKIIEEGKGKQPKASDRVKVHYKGTLIDGTQFDSSYDRGNPSVFGVSQVIKGWSEALQLMKEGAKWQLFIPSELAYGPTPRPRIPGNSVLVFDVELIEVVEPKEPEIAVDKTEDMKGTKPAAADKK